MRGRLKGLEDWNGPCAGHTVREPCVEDWNLKENLRFRRTVVGPDLEESWIGGNYVSFQGSDCKGKYSNHIPGGGQPGRLGHLTWRYVTRQQNANPRASRART
jgi:hypothetical protein